MNLGEPFDSNPHIYNTTLISRNSRFFASTAIWRPITRYSARPIIGGNFSRISVSAEPEFSLEGWCRDCCMFFGRKFNSGSIGDRNGGSFPVYNFALCSKRIGIRTAGNAGKFLG